MAMKMEEGKVEDMEICPSKSDLLTCSEELEKTELNKNDNKYTDLYHESNGIDLKNMQHFYPEEERGPRPPKEFLPVFVDVWTKMSPEIRQAYKIFRDLLSDKNKSITEPFLDEVDSTVPELADYHDRIKEPIDLFKISEKFHMMEYKSITELAADLRQMIENCYRYNGFESFVSKQAYKLEILLEQKLALLSRELRSKTSIAATNIAKEKAYLNALLFTSGGGRLSRKPANGESSLILLQIQLQDELEEKDRKKQKEKEKKEHNEALEEELEEWWKNISNSDFMTELSTTWEVPSVGIFIFVLKDLLNLQDLNYTEFELGTLFPQQSSLMAKIFTSLLVTPFQRAKLNRKEPMQYLIWEAKVNSKISSWYKMAYSRGQEYAASLFGFDPDLFDVLGYTNPFENFKYHQLPLRHRMWILKAFCEAALEQDSAMRDHFADLETLDRQDLCLGSDANGFSYHYFTSFGATDVRIYQQKANRVPDIPKIRDESRFIMKQEFRTKENNSSSKPLLVKKVLQMEEELVAKNNEKSVTIKEEQPHTRTSSRIRTKKSLSPQPLKAAPVKKERRPKKQAVEEFELVVSDIPSLSALVDKVAKQLKIKGHRRNPEKDLYQTLEALHEELSKREASLLRCSQKAKLKVMLECKQESEDSAVHNGAETAVAMTSS